MSIQHKDIPDAALHEPKGVLSASINTVYHANGTGSGVWKRSDAASLAGLSGDGGSSNNRILTNGSNGFRTAIDSAYGNMAFSNNNNSFSITAAVDPTLVSNSDYVLFTGVGAPLANEFTFAGVTFNTNRLTVPVSGVYRFDVWANISAFPSNTAKVGLKFRISASTFSPRTVIVKSNSAGDYGQFNGFGFITMNANDYVQLYVASSVTGGLTIQNLNCIVSLVRPT